MQFVSSLTRTLLFAGICSFAVACGSSDSDSNSSSANTAPMAGTPSAVGGMPAGGSMGQMPMMGATANAAIEIAGVWSDNFGGWTVINVDMWGDYVLHEYDNGGNWAITQNQPNDEFNPSKYSYVVWTEPEDDGSWWTCTVAFGIETIEMARMTENTSDASDPATSGCGDFSWTKMTPRSPIELTGKWADNFEGSTDISFKLWGKNKIHEYNNEMNWAVTQNPADDEFNPSKYNYVVWTQPDAENKWFTCTVAFGIETLEAALMTENTSDASDPGASGCGMFPWTQMMPEMVEAP